VHKRSCRVTLAHTILDYAMKAAAGPQATRKRKPGRDDDLQVTLLTVLKIGLSCRRLPMGGNMVRMCQENSSINAFGTVRGRLAQRRCHVVYPKPGRTRVAILKQRVAVRSETSDLGWSCHVVANLLSGKFAVVGHCGHKLAVGSDDVAEIILKVGLHVGIVY
jgi:hypothetical protein